MSRKHLLICLITMESSLSWGAAQSVLAPKGAAAETISNLGWEVIWLGAGVAIIVLILILIGAMHKQGTLDSHAPYNAGGGHPWILIGGFAAPAVILGIVFISTLSTLNKFPLNANATNVINLRVVGHQWWWEVKYETDASTTFSTANEIHIPVGQPVDIALESSDVIHSFWVPQLHGKIDLIPGQVNHIRILANEPGIYRGECAEFCGLQHTHMGFRVIAQPNEEFTAWKTNQLMPAVSSEVTQEGQELFLTHACAFCHTIRGISAAGSVAPDLTHLASRQTIAAGEFTNTRANLAAWVINAPSLKPGTQMPAMTQFTGEQLNALTTYLESLE